MNLFRLWFYRKEIELSPYPIVEGEEEYRVKREILSNMKTGRSETALTELEERGSLRNRERRNAD
jgi:hypothetical protein